MQKSTPNRSASRLWRRLLAVALAVPVAVAFAASGASAVESEPEAAEESEQLPVPIPDPGLPVPDPGDDPAADLIGQLGECVAALVETVVGAVSDAGGDVPVPGAESEQLPVPGGATDGLQPCLELLASLGLPVDLPVDVPLPLEDPAAKD